MLKAIFFKSSARKATAVSKLHRTFSETLMEDTIEKAEAVISKWVAPKNAGLEDIFNFSSLFCSANRREGKRFVQAVNDLQVTMQFMFSVSPRSEKLIRAQNLVKEAIKRLEKEFFWTLQSKRENLDADYSVSVHSLGRTETVLDSDSGGYRRSSSSSPPGLESADGVLDAEIMADLKTIADCLISAGRTKECLKIYKAARKSIIHEGLSLLGVRKMSFAQLQRLEPDVLESKIKSWLRVVKIAVARLFHGERVLCDHVFAACDEIKVSCFSDVTQDGIVTLFALPEGVSKFRKTPELMFRTLDLYETITTILPEIESVFSSKSASVAQSYATETLTKLGESASLMIEEFESAVQKETLKDPVPCGGVHPLARYVMNYTAFLADHGGSVAAIIAHWPLSQPPPPLPETYFAGGDGGANPSPVAVRLAWQMLVLLCKIDGKTELYKDPAISYLFLANNLDYVIARVRQSNLKILLGDDWIEKNEEKIKQYAARYEKLAWGRVMTSLPDDPTSEIPFDQAKECYKLFNESIEEAYKKQLTWIVPDPTLREQMKIPLSDKLLPGYRAFYERNRVGLGDFVKFTPEEIENYILKLFDGTARLGAIKSEGNNNNNSSGIRTNKALSFRSLTLGKARSSRQGRSRRIDFMW